MHIQNSPEASPLVVTKPPKGLSEARCLQCVHGVRLYNCVPCKGGGICQHGRVRGRCKDCPDRGRRRGNSCTCEHRRQRAQCSVCKPEVVFKQYAREALRRKLEFALTLDEFKELVAPPCLYCGDNETPRGIDRWDNKIGYVFENCRPCCGTCNYMKGRMDGATWVDQCQRVSDHTRVVELSDLQRQCG